MNMFCYCRMLRRVLYTSQLRNWSGAHCSQAFYSNHVFSPENITENTALENGAPTQIVRDVRRTEILWKNQKRGLHFQNFISYRFLENGGSPSYTVALLKTSVDHAHFSPSLVMDLLLTFTSCIQDNNIDFSPSLAEKTEALQYCLHHSDYNLLQLACNFFKITEENNFFTKFIDDLIKKQSLISAAFCIGALNLHHMYAVKEIVQIILHPLLLDGQISAVEACIANRPDLQLEVAKYLDSLIIITRSETDTLEATVQSKKALKILNHIVNAFKISPGQCKNLHYIRARAALNLLIKRKAEQSISDSTFEEMVMSIISENSNLKEHLIHKLVSRNDNETALKMVSKLNMTDYDIMNITINAEADTNLKTEEDRECVNYFEEICIEKSDVEDDVNHLTFDLKPSDVKFVDTDEKFMDCIQEITENYRFLGIDTEWKPHFGLSRDRLSLIQLAVHDKVYVLDIIALSDCLIPDHWNAFMDDIFGNSKIIKLGCAIVQDIEMILESNQGTKGKEIRFSNVLDVAIFYQRLQSVYPEEMGVNDDDIETQTRTKSLSKLCEIILGKPLNKEERLCDWEKRPLTESQLEYAALDAHCLLQIYDKIKKESVEKRINFEHQVKLAIFLTTEQWRPKKKMAKTQRTATTKRLPPTPVQEFKVMVDSEMGNLDQQLRQLGADVLTLSGSETPEEVVQISETQNRILICSHILWKKMNDKLPRRSCFRAITPYGEIVPVTLILHKYNVDLKAKVYAPPQCLVCNSEERVHISSEDLNFLHKQETNKDGTVLDIASDISIFQRTVKDMIASGICVKFSNQKSNSPSGNSYSFLCTKCGTIQ